MAIAGEIANTGFTWRSGEAPTMPCVSTEHTSIDHATASMQSRCVCVVVVARQGNENIHNPHIVGSPVITYERRAAAPTPAEPRDGHSCLRRPNAVVCPYKLSGGAMKAAAHIQLRGQKTAFLTFLLRQQPEPLTDGFTDGCNY